MATYYVSKSGNDSNNGLGPDASHGSNKPWLTIAKALGAAGIASGDTVYIGPGVYREVITVAMTSAVAETNVNGDPTNAQGFKDGSGVLLAAGEVQWTAYTTDDVTAPSASSTLAFNGRDFLSFRNIVFVGGASGSRNIVHADTTTSINIKFIQCVFITGSIAGIPVAVTNGANTALNWTIDSCIFLNSKAVSTIALTIATHTADYDTNFVVKNCLFLGGIRAVQVTNSNSGGGSGGGVLVFNCTMIGHSTAGVAVSSTGATQTFPCKTENSIIIMPAGTGLVSGHVAQHTEDFNWISAATARSNVTAGANSNSDQSKALLVDVGQWMINGTLMKPFFTPFAPIAGFGNTANGQAVDILQRPRPSGAASTSKSVGYLERHDFGTREATVVDASTYAIKLTGPGDHDILIPVDSAATVLSIRTRFDTNHATTNRPQAILLARADIGVATETKTATVAVDTWETLTFASFTPTAKGWVVLRLVSRAAAGSGIAYFDTLDIA